MKILGLDLSTHVGYAVLKDGQLLEYGTEHVQKFKEEPLNSARVPDYEKVRTAQNVASFALSKATLYNVDLVIIEQTNAGRFRGPQKELEFIHYAVINAFQNHLWANKHDAMSVKYIDTSKWRSLLGIKLTKEQRLHNKAVKAKVKNVRGKITPKHLAVAWVNQTYGLELLQKDHDAADAICMATCGPKLIEKMPITSVDEALGIKSVG